MLSSASACWNAVRVAVPRSSIAVTKLERPLRSIGSKIAPAFTSPWIDTVGFAWFSWQITTSPFGSSTRVGRILLSADWVIVSDGASVLAEIALGHPGNLFRGDLRDRIQ